MKSFAKKLLATTLSIGTLLPQAALAQTYNYDYDVTPTEATGLLAGLGVFLVFFLLVGLVSLVFWILMLVHAVKNDIPDKNMWIIILVVSFVAGLGLVGAIVYYFAVKNKFNAAKPPAAPAKKTK